MDAARLRDNRTDKEVSFKDAIVIFTTNAGKDLYEGESSGPLSLLPRDVILDALAQDINPKTKEPFFPRAICSRFASGNVLMFNHLEAHILRSIVEKQLNARVNGLKEAMGIEVEIDAPVATAILLAEGAAVRKLFATARRYAPSVLFIDEIDTIARARTGRDTDMGHDSEQILTTFFAEMDGFKTNPGKPVFVLGATNYGVEATDRLRLDPAMLRRFDRRILVDLPKLENRKQYLDEQISKKDIFHVDQEAIKSIAERSTGMSLAQLSSILDLSIRNALHEDASFVTNEMLEEAFESFNNGESRKWSPEITLRTARHEAGHVLVSWLCGEKPSFATIISRGDFGGYMQFASQENRMGYTKQELLNKIKTALGGRAAEIVYYGKEDGVSTGASGDLKSATDTAVRMLSKYGMDEQFGLAVIDQEQASDSVAQLLQSQVNDLLKKLLAEAIQTIREHRDTMDALVENLLKFNSLRANDIDTIMEKHV